MDLVALATELRTDPCGYGYAEYVADGSDQAVADLLNRVRPTIRVERSDITAAEILDVLQAGDRLSDYARAVLAQPQITATLVYKGFLAYVGAALATRPGSRAEHLFGAGTTVQHTDVAAALPGRRFGER